MLPAIEVEAAGLPCQVSASSWRRLEAWVHDAMLTACALMKCSCIEYIEEPNAAKYREPKQP